MGNVGVRLFGDNCCWSKGVEGLFESLILWSSLGKIKIYPIIAKLHQTSTKSNELWIKGLPVFPKIINYHVFVSDLRGFCSNFKNLAVFHSFTQNL